MILKIFNYLKSLTRDFNIIQKALLFLLLINLLMIPFWLMINLNGPLEYNGCEIKYIIEVGLNGYFDDGYCSGLTLPELFIWFFGNIVLIFGINLFSSEKKKDC
tara:strand:- start:44 stop:355 length:312 start_codon:yes stop_codon:yes gene_type:complete